jgi:hypothetical protein
MKPRAVTGDIRPFAEDHGDQATEDRPRIDIGVTFAEFEEKHPTLEVEFEQATRDMLVKVRSTGSVLARFRTLMELRHTFFGG